MKIKSITIVFENLDEITFPISDVKELMFYKTVDVDRLVGKKFYRRKVAISAYIRISNLLNTKSIVTNFNIPIHKYSPTERLLAFQDICSVYINSKSGKRLEYVMNWPENGSDDVNSYQSSSLSDDGDTITIKVSPALRKTIEELFKDCEEDSNT